MSEVADARATMRRLYGHYLESKASDQYCLTVYRNQRSGDGGTLGLEATNTAGGKGGPAVASVVEFAPLSARVDQPATQDSVGRAASGDSTDAQDDDARTEPPRHVRIHQLRTANYQAMTYVYDEIDRLWETSLGPGPEVTGARRIPSLMTQVCWLNRTLRTWAGPEVLADITGDNAVSSVDVPRPLVAESNSVNQRAIGSPAFRDRTRLTGSGVTVAVIDSEVSVGHPALQNRVVHRRNYTAESWGNPHLHGTAVAGIIAAQDVNNGGVAPGATIYNYKVLATNRLLNGEDFGAGMAIQQALEDGADVANCSWGAGRVVEGSKSRLAVAVDQAWALGMPVVKSAGNDGPGNATMTIPAEADGIVVVGGTDLAGKAVQSYSSRGPIGTRLGPHVVAPGGGGPDGNITCCLVSGGFGNAGSGTSYSAPHVSGMFALWLEGDPSLEPTGLRHRLVGSAKNLGLLARFQGAGLAYLAGSV